MKITKCKICGIKGQGQFNFIQNNVLKLSLCEECLLFVQTTKTKIDTNIEVKE